MEEKEKRKKAAIANRIFLNRYYKNIQKSINVE